MKGDTDTGTHLGYTALHSSLASQAKEWLVTQTTLHTLTRHGSWEPIQSHSEKDCAGNVNAKEQGQGIVCAHDQWQPLIASLRMQRNARHNRPNFNPSVCGKWPEIVYVAIIGAAESLLFLPSTPYTYREGCWDTSLTFCLCPTICFAHGGIKDVFVQRRSLLCEVFFVVK